MGCSPIPPLVNVLLAIELIAISPKSSSLLILKFSDTVSDKWGISVSDKVVLIFAGSSGTSLVRVKIIKSRFAKFSDGIRTS